MFPTFAVDLSILGSLQEKSIELLSKFSQNVKKEVRSDLDPNSPISQKNQNKSYTHSMVYGLEELSTETKHTFAIYLPYLCSVFITRNFKLSEMPYKSILKIDFHTTSYLIKLFRCKLPS